MIDAMQGTPHTPVKLGDVGDEVRFLQEQLRASNDYHGQIDGQFGYATLQAVQAFQALRGLPDHGDCDEATWAAVDPISVLPNPTRDVHISDGPHLQGNWITVGATVRSGRFEAGEITTSCWVQTDDGNDPRTVWQVEVRNDDALEAGGGLTYGWGVEGLEAGAKYLACVTVNIHDITDSVQDENNWMAGFTWDGQQATDVQQYR